MSMKKTLLVDTNRAAYPIYQSLFEKGHEVWVVGNNPNETLAKLAENYVQLDYSDRGKLAAFIDEKGFDYLVPGCTDLSYQVCSEINNGRFPGIDSVGNTFKINTKNEFRRIAEELGLPVPRILPLEAVGSVESAIVKPVDSFSGRGIKVLRQPSPEELQRTFEEACKASKSGSAIIEEFVSGQLFSHSAFVRRGEIVADFIVQEDCTTNPFTVDTSRVAAEFSPSMLSAIRSDVCRLAQSLQLLDGLVHTQFIVRDDRYWIIEMTRRCPGDIYSLLIEFSTGYPYAKSYAASFIEETAADRRSDHEVAERIIRHTVTSKNGEALWGFQFSQPVDIRLFVPLATSGDLIEASPYGRVGIFFFSTPSAKEQDELYGQLLAGKLYTFSSSQRSK